MIALVLGGTLLITGLSLLAALPVEKPSASPLLNVWTIFTTLAAGLASLLLALVNRMLRRTADQPRWFLAVTALKIASLPAVLLLVITATTTWLAGSLHAALFFRASVLLIVAFGLLGFWTQFALQMHIFLQRR